MFRAATRVHGSELAVEQEAEPPVAARAELQRRRVAPHVQRVAPAAQRPLRPRVAHAARQARRVFAATYTKQVCNMVRIVIDSIRISQLKY